VTAATFARKLGFYNCSRNRRVSVTRGPLARLAPKSHGPRVQDLKRDLTILTWRRGGRDRDPSVIPSRPIRHPSIEFAGKSGVFAKNPAILQKT
jgi:hypothetical protein